jgi:hypothetical protein
VVSSACAATSGSWYSPYDGATWTAAADVDIDHVVPYPKMWIAVKYYWAMTLQSAEKTAVQTMLNLFVLRARACRRARGGRPRPSEPADLRRRR